MLQMPQVLEYSNPITYLNDIVSYKKSTNPKWSLGVWARQLNLSGTASISRILTHDRLPGEEIEQALAVNLALSPDEALYFKRLLERERYYQQSKIGQNIKLTMRNVQGLYLVGTVSYEKTRALLEPHGLEPVAINNSVVASVNFNFYKNTTIGSYNEAHFTFTAKHKKAGLLDSGLFFSNFKYNSKVMTLTTSLMWGYGSSYLKFDSHFADELKVSAGKETVFKTELNKKSSQVVDESYETTGYAVKTNQSLHKTKFSIDTIGWQFPVSEKNDVVQLNYVPGLEELARSLEFKYEKWVFHENLFCLVREPEKFDRTSSF